MEGRKRYLEKLQVANLKECPYRLPEGSWSSELIAWPELQYPVLYDYLINSPCMYCRHFHIVYSENLLYFTCLWFTASNVWLARVNSMHLGLKIFGVHYALFLAYGVEANGKKFEQGLLLVLVWVGAVYLVFGAPCKCCIA